MTSGGIYKYPGFEGTRISLSPKHESSLKCFLKAILNIWGHCKYRQSSLPSLWWAFTTAAHPSQSGVRVLPHCGWTTALRHILPVSALRSLRGPESTLAFVVVISYLFTLLQSVTVYLFISFPLPFLIGYFWRVLAGCFVEYRIQNVERRRR